MISRFLSRRFLSTGYFFFSTLLALPSAARAVGEIEQPSETFRSIFYTLASDTYSQDELQKLIFVPSPDYLKPRAIEGTGEESVKKRAEAWKAVTPTQLYELGKAQPVKNLENVNADLEKKPVTVVIVPGIFGEFIKHSPFEEVFKDGESTFAKTWKTKLEAKPTEDEVFDLAELKKVNRDLRDIVLAASIDDANGKELVRLIYLKPLFGSLETLGTIRDSSDVYLGRLNKIQDVLGGLEDVYIMGYSRGLNVAQDLIAQAHADEDRYTWMKSVKGLVSLGGTFLGSPLADVAFQEGKVPCEMLARLNRLAGDLTVLEPGSNFIQQTATVAMNAGAWASALADLLVLGGKMERHEGLTFEDVPTDMANLGAFGSVLNTVITDTFPIAEGSEYNNNVEKFRYFIKEVTEGIASITEKESIAWLKENTLPEDLLYASIHGTMADPTTSPDSVSDLIKTPVSYNPKAIDYRALRTSYYDYLTATGTPLNDSQVSPDRTVFWSELHSSLNPKQKKYETKVIAMLGVDHWGMSFPVALESQNEEVSPYPRKILMHALGAYLAQSREMTTEKP